MRGGDCIGIPQVWGDCCLSGFVPSLICEVDLWVALCLASVLRLHSVWERSCVLPVIILPKILSGGSLCGRVSGNPSVWRRGRKAVCSNLETYLGVCDWSTFSYSLSYIVDLFILSYHIHAWFVCVPYLCSTTRASYSTSSLIQRNQEELVQSSSPGIRLHSLVIISVLLCCHLSFNFRILFIRLAVHLFTPPLGVLTTINHSSRLLKIIFSKVFSKFLIFL